MLCLADDRHDETPLECHSNAKIDVLVVADRSVFNRRIDDRIFAQSINSGGGDERHEGELDAYMVLECSLLALAETGDARHVDLVDRVRVRALLQALHHSLANNGAHLRHRY